jgi:hypothetical protein
MLTDRGECWVVTEESEAWAFNITIVFMTFFALTMVGCVLTSG